jgi:site-specific recombinase XerD
MVRGRTYPPDPPTRAEVVRIMDACSRRAPTGLRDRALIALLYRTGLRVSEALSLRPSDLDPERRLVRVARGKGGGFRLAAIDDEALAHVAAWLERRRALGHNGHHHLFCTLGGRRLGGNQVRVMLHRRAAKAGVDRRVTPHQLRHAMAVELVGEGEGLDAVQRQLGHSSVVHTAWYLRRVAPVDLSDLAARRPRWA